MYTDSVMAEKECLRPETFRIAMQNVSWNKSNQECERFLQWKIKEMKERPPKMEGSTISCGKN